MFTLEGVISAPNSAEATARYWAWRASQAGSTDADLLLRSKVLHADPRMVDGMLADNSVQRDLVERVVLAHGRPSTEAGRLAIYHALYGDLQRGLMETPPRRDGVLYQTDYVPVGRLAVALAGVDPTGLPARTTTSTHQEFVYSAEQGRPFTVIHGDFLVAQTHLVEVHHIEPSEIVPLTA